MADWVRRGEFWALVSVGAVSMILLGVSLYRGAPERAIVMLALLGLVSRRLWRNRTWLKP